MALSGSARTLEVGKLLLLLCAVSIVTRVAFLGAGFTNVDEGAHWVGAREFIQGGRLYVDFADNKPPLVYAYYAIADALFGRGLFGVRLFAASVTFPAIALCAAAFFDFDRRGRAAAIAFLVASAALLPSDAHAINGEHILLVPLAIAAALTRTEAATTRPGRMLLVGILIGVAALAKQPAALCGAAFAWSVICANGSRARRRLLSLSMLGLGFALPLMAWVALFARQGTLEAFVYWAFRYNLLHMSNPMTFGDRLFQLLKMGSVLIPSVGTLAVAWAWTERTKGMHDDPHRRRLILGLVITTLLPAFLGWRLFGHYFVPLLFALSLGAGPFFADFRPLSRKVAAGVLVVACLAFTIAGRIVHDPLRNLTDVNDPRYEQIAKAMPSNCGVSRPLFVWGYAPQLYVQSGHRPASRFVVPIDTITGHIVGNDTFVRGALDTSDRIVAEHWDQLMSDLERSRPEWVVDTAPADLNHWGRYPLLNFHRLHAFVRSGYREQGNVGGAILYRRTDCPRATTR